MEAVLILKFDDAATMLVDETELIERETSEAEVVATAGPAGTVGGLTLVIKIWDVLMMEFVTGTVLVVIRVAAGIQGPYAGVEVTQSSKRQTPAGW